MYFMKINSFVIDRQMCRCIASVLLLGIAGCTSPRLVITPEGFKDSEQKLILDMGSEGFSVIGKHEETKTRWMFEDTTALSGVFGTVQSRERETIYSEYTFINEQQQKVDLQYSYNILRDQRHQTYIEDIRMTKCETTSPDIYEKLCTEKGVAKQIEKTRPNQQRSFMNNEATVALGLVLGSLFSALIYFAL